MRGELASKLSENRFLCVFKGDVSSKLSSFLGAPLVLRGGCPEGDAPLLLRNWLRERQGLDQGGAPFKGLGLGLGSFTPKMF